MGKFDLGDEVRLQRSLSIGPETTYRKSQELLLGYEREGFRVEFLREDAPVEGGEAHLEALLTNRAGTRIRATLAIRTDAPSEGFCQTDLDVELRGVVVLSGVQGMLASAGTVRRIAREKLGTYLHEILEGVPPEPAPRARGASRESSEEATSGVSAASAQPEALSDVSAASAEPEEPSGVSAASAEPDELGGALAANAPGEDDSDDPQATEPPVVKVSPRPQPPESSSADTTRGRAKASPPRSGQRMGEPFDTLGAFGTVAAEALVEATSQALAAAEALVDASGIVGRPAPPSEVPPPEPLPEAEPLPTAEGLPPAEPLPAPEPLPPSGRGSIADRLERAKELLERGLITEAEYQAKKAQLLDEL